MKIHPVMVCVFCVLCFVAMGCAEEDCSGPVQIQVRNTTATNFDQVNVSFSQTPTAYGALAAGATSEPKTIEQAYSYAYTQVIVGDQTYTLQPIDFVGEEPLCGDGVFTYALSLNGDTVNIQLIAP